MIAVVVLAAGTSSRLGRLGPKQLLPLEGAPILQHVIDAAAASSPEEIVVVLGHSAKEIEAALRLPKGARVATNPDYGSGQAGSLRTGLASLDPRTDAAVILVGDQPAIGPGPIRRVVEEFERTGGPIVRARYLGTPGHPVALGRSVWGRLSELAGDVGARELMEANPGLVRDVELGEAPPVDVDTWNDYQRIMDAGPGRPARSEPS
jgi:molybdenum cofactor cytidylyltransferase